MFREPPEFFEQMGGRRAFFGLFGKHRAWADHMDDVGMESPTLRYFKKELYLDGIRTVIDSGLWKGLGEGEYLKKWNHRMLIHAKDGILLAQLWQSKDQRGRKEYPLVAAIHIGTGHLPASLEPLWEIFDEIRSLCVNSETQDEVKQTGAIVPGLIEKAMRQVQAMPPEGISYSERQKFLTSSVMGEQEIGLSRFLYRIAVELKDFLPGRATASGFRAFRLPIHEDMGPNALLVYLSLLRTQIGKRYPVIACQNMKAGHFDLSVGGMHERFVADLKCSREKVALVTDVAFNIPDETDTRIRDVIGTFSAEPVSEVMVIADPGAKEKGRSFFGSIMNRISNKD